jgi:dolichol-phosphate mannosyltransferase
MSANRSAASVIVPTYQEAANIRALGERTFAALRAAGIEAELIIVDDDSRDGTEEIVQSLATAYPVRVVVRRGVRGLAGAVLTGFQHARFDRFVVLDGDLQHPPEFIPRLLARLEEADCEFVVGSRYVPEAQIGSSWPLGRRLASYVARALAYRLFPVHDPLSGFFALPRSVWQRAANLNPIGYKIGLELFVKGGCRQAAEVPIPFSERQAGTSKFNAREVWRFLKHLLMLHRYRIRARRK